MKRPIVLTGITTSGSPHLGNYVGAIKPAIDASKKENNNSFFFLADYHAIVKTKDSKRIAQSTLEIASAWIALGLDPTQVTFYRQSDIPEITELSWILNTIAAKGLLNRAHAYKSAVQQNLAAKEDEDAGISMGLFGYPVLMAADILMFNAEVVPVGKDQAQHIEMARDIAQRFNHLYGKTFELPNAQIDQKTSVLTGLDGRKMSKSYDNTIPLFCTESQLKKYINKIKTNLLEPGESKDPNDSIIFEIWSAFATEEDSEFMRLAFKDGIGWGDAKQKLFHLINGSLIEARETYFQLLNKPEDIEEILNEGSKKARPLAQSRIKKIRESIGLKPLF